MTQVIPAIIAADFPDLEHQIEKVYRYIERVQIDIMDGEFAPTTSWPFGDRKNQQSFIQIREEESGLPHWQEVGFEIDMMVREPERYIEAWLRAGVDALIIHYGSTEEFKQIQTAARAVDVEVGVAITPDQSVREVLEEWSGADFVQLMGNDKIGYHGVDLDPLVYEKIKEVRSAGFEKDIAIDIGVDLLTAPKLIAAGATKLVSGSAILESGDIEQAVRTLENS
jgi:ribulose-phosphate 3-epimerase